MKVSLRAPAFLLVLAAVAGPAAAQPEPSFRAGCGELRAALARLPSTKDITIQVIGRLTGARFDGAVAYLTLCGAPDPLVLCVSYSTNDRKVGDEVVLSGAYEDRGPDRVLLDPCLNFSASGE